MSPLSSSLNSGRRNSEVFSNKLDGEETEKIDFVDLYTLVRARNSVSVG